MALPLMWLVLAVAGFTPTISPVHANNSAAASAAETRSDPSPWVDRRGQLTPNVEQMAQQIQTSLYHGLNPEAYELQKILTLTEKALSPTTTDLLRI